MVLLANERLNLAGTRFIDNEAVLPPSALFLSATFASTVSDTNFSGNVVRPSTDAQAAHVNVKDVTILAATSLVWPCPLGHWMPDVGSLVGDLDGCDRLCAEGYYGNATILVTSSCSGPCPTGHYCPEGSAEPLQCPAGTRMPSERAVSNDSCIPCAPGQHQPESGKEECLSCEAGSFSSVIGSVGCEPCPPGGYCEMAGAATAMVWEPCPAGSYNPNGGSSSNASCLPCPVGTSSATSGATSNETCALCRPGFYAAAAGCNQCESCSAGTSSDEGSGSCSECVPGFYAENPGQGECIPCPYPLGSGTGSAICSVCMAGYYLLDSSADAAAIFKAPTKHCKLCPPKANCSTPNTTLETLGVPRGYWRASDSSATLTECRTFGGGDEAGRTRCAGSDPVLAGTADGRMMREADLDYCAPGFAGPECQLCAATNHYLKDGDTCDECLALGTAAGQITALVVGICILLGLAAHAYSKPKWRKKPCIGCLLRLADRGVGVYFVLGLTPKLKILLSFYQICIVLNTTYSARLPKKYTTLTDELSEGVNIDWSGFFLPPQCLAYWARLVAVTISPVGLIALLLIAGAALRLRRWRDAPTPRPRSWPAEAALGVLDFTPASLIIVFCFVPSVSASIFRAWSCQSYTISPPDQDLVQVSYMRQDASIECYTAEHDSITLIAGLLLGLWPFGSMVLYGSLLAACYKPLHAKTPTALTRATAFLHREYEKTWYWWEALELARKLVLTGAVLLIPEESAFVRLVVATLICSCYSVGLAVVRPYKRLEDDVLAIATSLVLLLLFLGTNWTTIFLAIEERYPNENVASDVMGFSHLSTIVDAMLVLVTVALLLFLVGTIFAIRRFAKVRTIRLVSSKHPPELSLATGHTWHLFNSHIWSTGQDAVAVIKSELMLLLPGIKVFLDVRALLYVWSHTLATATLAAATLAAATLAAATPRHRNPPCRHPRHHPTPDLV